MGGSRRNLLLWLLNVKWSSRTVVYLSNLMLLHIFADTEKGERACGM